VREAVSAAARDQRSDAELLAAMRTEPGRALGALYDRYARVVYGLARTMLTSPTEAEDLTQDVFLALCGEHRYDPARGSLTAFLVAMTRSRAIDRLRGRCRSARFRERCAAQQPCAEAHTPFEDVVSARVGERVRAGLAALPTAERRVLEMGYYGGLTQREIAARLSTSLGRVKHLWRSGLATLARAVAPC